MKNYLLNGNEAHGDDYLTALNSLREEDFLRITNQGNCGLIVSVCSDGFFVTENREDGSSYLTTGLSKERIRALIHGFVNNEKSWRDGLEWELTAFPSKRATRRVFALLIIGSVLFSFALWLIRYIAG